MRSARNIRSLSPTIVTKEKPPGWLSLLKDLAQIIALVGIPLALAIGGYWTSGALQEKQFDEKYVEIAIGILANEKANANLKTWAFEVVKQKSPVPMNHVSQKSVEDVAPQISNSLHPLTEKSIEAVNAFWEQQAKKNK